MSSSEPREGREPPSLERQAVVMAGQVATQLHHRFRSYFALEELRSLALTPALLAAREWDGRGSFPRFVVQRIRWALLDELRRERRQTAGRGSAGSRHVIALAVERVAEATAAGEEVVPDPPPAKDVLAAMMRNAAAAVSIDLDAAGLLPDPRENVETNVVRMRLRRAVQELPAKEREVIEQHGYQGATFDEIATANGVQTSTVFSRYTRALERLRDTFEERAPDSG